MKLYEDTLAETPVAFRVVYERPYAGLWVGRSTSAPSLVAAERFVADMKANNPQAGRRYVIQVSLSGPWVTVDKELKERLTTS